MQITVFGVGGVGGYLAARLAADGTHDVSAIARGRHLEAIQRDGLRLRSPHGDVRAHVRASEDPADVGPVDLVLLATKGTDVAGSAARMAPLLGPDTLVVTLQNGVTSHEVVAAAVGHHRVLPGLAYIFSTIAAPGVVSHTAGPGRYVFGEPGGGRSPRALAVEQALRSAGVDAEAVDDVQAAMWTKFVLICATAGVTAPSRLPLDVLRQDAHARVLMERLAQETAEVGRATGVALPGDAVARAMAFVDDIGPGAYSSLLYDLVHGKPMELEGLHGTVVELADRHGLEVPATRTVHALLSPWAADPASLADSELRAR